MTMYGDPSRMSGALLEKARQEAAQHIALAEKEAAAVLAEAEKEARRVIDDAVMQAEHTASRDAKRRSATAETEAERLVSDARDELIQLCIHRLRDVLKDLPGTQEYRPALEALIREAAEALEGATIVVQLREADQAVLDTNACRALDTTLGQTVRVASKPAMIAGGVIVWSEDGRLRVDQSFEALVDRHEEALRAIIAQELWPESADISTGSQNDEGGGSHG